jgi:hypothetical protein
MNPPAAMITMAQQPSAELNAAEQLVNKTPPRPLH